MEMKKHLVNIFFVCLLTLVLFSCRKDPANSDANPLLYNPDWTEASHGKAPPNYQTVFPQDKVNRLDIEIGSAEWNNINLNMETICGIPFGATVNEDGPSTFADAEYVSSSVAFNGKKWKNVGFRLKGNKGLFYAWNKGIYKLPFRLNFDKFEDEFPGIINQHFYGFEELSFSPGLNDPSLIREKLAADVFRNAGVPAAQTSFCRVFVDIGNGPKYWGLYCMLELPEDNMIRVQLGEAIGNIYKPTSRLNFFDIHDFEKKNNNLVNDYSDISQLLQLLNSPLRISNNTQWKADLEKLLNIDAFLQWLAVNNAIVNKNSYGNNDENYYLYNHSNTGFNWIPWDNDETLTGNPGIVGVPGGGQNGLSMSMNEVTANWPLIRYLMDNNSYNQTYKNKLRTFLNLQMESGELDRKIDAYHSLITPYVVGIDGEQSGYSYLNNSGEFVTEKNNLHVHIQNRINVINQFLP
jgi:spore coat protein CotH